MKLDLIPIKPAVLAVRVIPRADDALVAQLTAGAAQLPPGKRSLGLIYAVNAFGADHQSSEHDSMLRTKPGSLHRRRLAVLGEFGDLDLRDLSDAKVRFAYTTQCFYSCLLYTSPSPRD